MSLNLKKRNFNYRFSLCTCCNTFSNVTSWAVHCRFTGSAPATALVVASLARYPREILSKLFVLNILMSSFRSKWYMPETIYPRRRYPHYCMGYSTLFTTGVMKALYDYAQTQNQSYIEEMWIDDVLYSGIYRVNVREKSAVKKQLFFHNTNVFFAVKSQH